SSVATPPAAIVGSLIADPRVENGVQQVDEQVGDQEDDHQQHDDTGDDGAFLGQNPVEHETADAVDAEDAFGHDRAAHQAAQVGTQEGDHRDHRVAQQVHADHPAVRQALGHRGAHEVGAPVLRDRRPGQPGNVGHRQAAEDEPGGEQLTEARVRRHRQVDDAGPAAQHQLDDEAGDEHRQGGQHQRGHQHQVVAETAAPQTGEDTGGDTDQRLESDRDRGQLQRDRGGVLDQHADLTVGVGHPEVALQQVTQVREVLDEDVLVQVVLFDHRLAELRRTHALAHAGERVAGQGPHQHVDQERGADEHRDELQ